MVTERTPLLEEHTHRHFWQLHDDEPGNSKKDPQPVENIETFHTQFCTLVGIPPSDLPLLSQDIPPKSLYGRALRYRRSQQRTYAFTATLSNTLLLSQVVLGAALTALGASESSHILITLFGAANTIIAGVVAYLKSRGQPQRARMFRDDLERVVDEIENSEIMWRGISKSMHGYNEIPVKDGQVSVRSEVARLTRLYDKTIRTNTLNNPDIYQSEMFGGITSGSGGITKLMRQPELNTTTLVTSSVLPPAQADLGASLAASQAAVVPDLDQSPATQPVTQPVNPVENGDKDDKAKYEKDKNENTDSKADGTKAPEPKGKEPAK